MLLQSFKTLNSQDSNDRLSVVLKQHSLSVFTQAVGDQLMRLELYIVKIREPDVYVVSGYTGIPGDSPERFTHIKHIQDEGDAVEGMPGRQVNFYIARGISLAETIRDRAASSLLSAGWEQSSSVDPIWKLLILKDIREYAEEQIGQPGL